MEQEEVFECFGSKIIKKKAKELEPLLKRNLLISFFVPFCRAGLMLIFLTRRNEGQQNGFNFDELGKLLKNSNIPRELLHRYLERALDILLDIGLFSAKWEQKDDCWQRVFYNRNEVARRLAPYEYFISPSLNSVKTLQFFELLLFGPDQDPFFFLKILDINRYLAHTGDVIDPDHWRINIKCEPISYSKLWSILKEISQSKIYDANVKFHHERKKITIYGLNNWIGDTLEKIKKEKNLGLEPSQCKIRFLLRPKGVPEGDQNYDFEIEQLLIVPITNVKIKGLEKKADEDYPSEIDNIVSELAKTLILRLFQQLKGHSVQISSVNAECELLKIKDEDIYQNSLNKFRKELAGYSWDNGLEMGLKHLECWRAFVPEVIRKKAEDIEKSLRQCIIDQCKTINGENNLFLTLARKGDVLVKHLYELSTENAPGFVEILKKFDKNYIDGKFHNMSEVEFFIKAKQGKIEINNLVIFDDAVDEGKKLRSVVNKIMDMVNLRVSNIKAIAFIANKKKFDDLANDLEAKGVKISACSLA